MFAALAMVAKDKLGFWSSRAKGASEACFLFCYFFLRRECGAVLFRQSLFPRSRWQKRGFGERMVLLGARRVGC